MVDRIRPFDHPGRWAVTSAVPIALERAPVSRHTSSVSRLLEVFAWSFVWAIGTSVVFFRVSDPGRPVARRQAGTRIGRHLVRDYRSRRLRRRRIREPRGSSAHRDQAAGVVSSRSCSPGAIRRVGRVRAHSLRDRRTRLCLVAVTAPQGLLMLGQSAPGAPMFPLSPRLSTSFLLSLYTHPDQS